MNILSYLYTLIITPLELLFENIFMIANRIIGNEGLSIIFLSLAVNLLVLPLYKRADELQAEERDIQAKMAPWIKHIKKTFSGDERFFMLQEYYRINHYKPIYALKSSVSVMLQIPFFIAAYNLLSGMQSLQGMRFGFITDLGKEDALFMIGSFPVNVLPILMTVINVVSGIIYTKGHPLKEKIQVYGLAAVFLVFLYRSSAGLVFYWLLNNVFSLVKNIFYKLKDPKKAFKTVLAAAGAATLVLSLIRNDLDIRQRSLLAIVGISLFIPLVSDFFKKKDNTEPQKGDTALFFSGAVLMALLTGLVIPSNVVNSSPLEFIVVSHPVNPGNYMISTMLLSIGTWVIWCGIFYLLMNEKSRAIFCKAIWAFSGASLVNYILFNKKAGILTSTLNYENPLTFDLKEHLLNAFIMIALTMFLWFFCFRFKKATKSILVIAVLTSALFGCINLFYISKSYTGYIKNETSSGELPNFTLSTQGKNVVVLMLDRAISNYIPYIFNEKPELIRKFDGFTFYPNTISYGAYTNTGTPALYGGYEYTPERINQRSSETLESKQNEALKVMPVIFGEQGYKVTVCDPTYAGYKNIPDLSIFKDYPSFRCFNTLGRFNYFEDNEKAGSSENIARINNLRNRNLFCFSLMKIMPYILQETVYDNGLYNGSNSNSGITENTVNASSLTQTRTGLSKSTGYRQEFIEAYAVLTNLPKITNITDSSENTFLMMSNDTTHSQCYLQKPEYTPSFNVDNTAYDSKTGTEYTVNGVTMKMSEELQVAHYHVNMAAYLKLADWFDYLRRNNVYDNTRIILVADHGNGLDQFDVKCGELDTQFFMPLLMVKDFNAKGFNVCEDFMTNADTPSLATSGIVKDPVNPFTGKPIDSKAKNGPQTVFFTKIFITDYNNGNTFLPGSWYSVNGNPHDPASWKYLGKH